MIVHDRIYSIVATLVLTWTATCHDNGPEENNISQFKHPSTSLKQNNVNTQNINKKYNYKSTNEITSEDYFNKIENQDYITNFDVNYIYNVQSSENWDESNEYEVTSSESMEQNTKKNRNNQNINNVSDSSNSEENNYLDDILKSSTYKPEKSLCNTPNSIPNIDNDYISPIMQDSIYKKNYNQDMTINNIITDYENSEEYLQDAIRDLINNDIIENFNIKNALPINEYINTNNYEPINTIGYSLNNQQSSNHSNENTPNRSDEKNCATNESNNSKKPLNYLGKTVNNHPGNNDSDESSTSRSNEKNILSSNEKQSPQSKYTAGNSLNNQHSNKHTFMTSPKSLNANNSLSSEGDQYPQSKHTPENSLNNQLSNNSSETTPNKSNENNFMSNESNNSKKPLNYLGKTVYNHPGSNDSDELSSSGSNEKNIISSEEKYSSLTRYTAGNSLNNQHRNTHSSETSPNRSDEKNCVSIESNNRKNPLKYLDKTLNNHGDGNDSDDLGFSRSNKEKSLSSEGNHITQAIKKPDSFSETASKDSNNQSGIFSKITSDTKSMNIQPSNIETYTTYPKDSYDNKRISSIENTGIRSLKLFDDFVNNNSGSVKSLESSSIEFNENDVRSFEDLTDHFSFDSSFETDSGSSDIDFSSFDNEYSNLYIKNQYGKPFFGHKEFSYDNLNSVSNVPLINPINQDDINKSVYKSLPLDISFVDNINENHLLRGCLPIVNPNLSYDSNISPQHVLYSTPNSFVASLPNVYNVNVKSTFSEDGLDNDHNGVNSVVNKQPYDTSALENFPGYSTNNILSSQFSEYGDKFSTNNDRSNLLHNEVMPDYNIYTIITDYDDVDNTGSFEKNFQLDNELDSSKSTEFDDFNFTDDVQYLNRNPSLSFSQ